MSAISFFFDAHAAQRLASMSFRQVILSVMSRFRVMRALPDVADMHRSDRAAMRPSDYERISQRWDRSPYQEIRNHVGVWQ